MAARFVDNHGQHADKRADHYAAILIANRSARNEILSLHRAGKIHDSVLHSLEAELDLEEVSAQRSMIGPKLD
jgi:monovalent cation/hydrogen antiporter